MPMRKLRWSVDDERKISEAAARNARTAMQTMGWSAASSGSVQPMHRPGYVGLRTTVDYVRFQNDGIKPFLMTWVEGRVVPINDSGTTHFVLGKEVGQPGYVTLPGGMRKWRDQKWRHPGLKPKRFLEKALDDAMKEFRPRLHRRLLDAVQGKVR